MSNTVEIHDIWSIIDAVRDRDVYSWTQIIAGESAASCSSPHAHVSEQARYRSDMMNEELDQIIEPRVQTPSTSGSRSTDHSSIFDTMPNSGSDRSIVFTAPSTRNRIPQDLADFMARNMSRPNVDRLPCEFAKYSRCRRTFPLTDLDQWMDHIIVDHLDHKLPNKCVCWFCDDISFDAEAQKTDRLNNFFLRLEHIRDHFRDDHYTVDEIRPDFAFISHLHHHQLISDRMFHRTESWGESPAPTNPDLYSHDFIPPKHTMLAQRAGEMIHDLTREDRRRGDTQTHGRSNRTSQLRSSYFSPGQSSTPRGSRP